MGHPPKFNVLTIVLLVLILSGGIVSLVMAAPVQPQSGSISGLVTYSGSIGGNHEIIVAAHPAVNAPPVTSDHLFSGETYTLPNLPDGSYYISAFLDANDSGGGPPDSGEPTAYYDGNNDGTPDTVAVNGGTVTGIDIALTDGTPPTAAVTGQVSYVGTAISGTHEILVSAHVTPGDDPLYSVHVMGPVSTYTLPVTNGSYYIIAFLDGNDSGGGPPDNGEPIAIYDSNGDGLPDLVTVSDTLQTGIDLTLYDNFVQGTAVYRGGIAGNYPLEVGLHEAINQEPISSMTLTTPGGPYTLSALPGNYYVSAFVDFNNSSGPPDANELTTYYDANGDGIPDRVALFTETVTINFELGNIIYVDAAATGAATGSSWVDAYTDFNVALAAAVPGQEIWLAAGIYTPGANRTDTFTLTNGVAVYGGFTGTESWRADRDYAQNRTILSGDIGTLGTASDNVYHVVTVNNVDETTVLDGVVITGGYANGDFSYDKGGGIYNIYGRPTLANLQIIGNYAANHGGGMVNQYPGAYPLIINCQFSGNSTQYNGGAIANLDNANPSIINSSITGNLGANGGGIVNLSGFNQESHATIDNTILWGNQGQEIGLQGPSTVSVTYSIVEGGYPGSGNLNSNPLFVDANGADDTFGTLDDDLHLQAGSPAIDAGNNALLPRDRGDSDGDADVDEIFPLDGEGQTRQLDDPATPDTGSGVAPLVDIGADEYRLTAINGLQATSSSPTPLGNTTFLTATIQNGSGVSYAWAFGDGQMGSGPVSPHTYSVAGVYTAVVTATNGLGSETASTNVTVYETIPVTPGSSQTTSDNVLQIEAAAGTAVATLRYVPQAAPAFDTGTLSLAGVYFQLTAADSGGNPISGILTPPLTLTVTYDEADLPPFIPEARLQLLRFDTTASQWVPLAVISRNLLTNKIVVQLDHLSDFALLGEGNRYLYLPLIVQQ